VLENMSFEVFSEEWHGGGGRKGSFDTHGNSLCFWLRAACI